MVLLRWTVCPCYSYKESCVSARLGSGPGISCNRQIWSDLVCLFLYFLPFQCFLLLWAVCPCYSNKESCVSARLGSGPGRSCRLQIWSDLHGIIGLADKRSFQSVTQTDVQGVSEVLSIMRKTRNAGPIWSDLHVIICLANKRVLTVRPRQMYRVFLKFCHLCVKHAMQAQYGLICIG